MIKKLGRALLGSVRWVAWLLALTLVLATALAMAMIATPIVFVILWRAHSMAEAFDSIIERVTDKIADEMNKLDKKAIYNFEFEDDDDEDLF